MTPSIPPPAWRYDHAAADIEPVAARLESWGGRLIVSMPRTGSTLLGTVMLLSGGLDRYLHEPAAPVFWEEAPPGVVLGEQGGAGPGDVVQESGYQFASAALAGVFLDAARAPVAFTMRDPRLAWPSRWRLMFREWLHTDPADRDAGRMRSALESDDFSGVGDLLTKRVPQPDHGLGAFLALLGECDRRGLAVALIDNGRFREDPGRILERICASWDLTFHEAMVRWPDLGPALPGVVMTDLGRREYPWYYERTLASRGGIAPERTEPLPLDRFPPVLRGEGVTPLTIDTAAAWHAALLARPDTL